MENVSPNIIVKPARKNCLLSSTKSDKTYRTFNESQANEDEYVNYEFLLSEDEEQVLDVVDEVSTCDSTHQPAVNFSRENADNNMYPDDDEFNPVNFTVLAEHKGDTDGDIEIDSNLFSNDIDFLMEHEHAEEPVVLHEIRVKTPDKRTKVSGISKIASKLRRHTTFEEKLAVIRMYENEESILDISKKTGIKRGELI